MIAGALLIQIEFDFRLKTIMVADFRGSCKGHGLRAHEKKIFFGEKMEGSFGKIRL